MSIEAEGSTRSTVADATALLPTDSAGAESILKQILSRPAGRVDASLPLLSASLTRPAGPKDEELLREKEAAILKLGELYRDKK